MSDREQLIRQIAEHRLRSIGDELIDEGFSVDLFRSEAAAWIDAVHELGFAVVPVTVPGLPSEQRSPAVEGSEATSRAERAVLDAAKAWAAGWAVHPSDTTNGPLFDAVHSWLASVGVESEVTP